MCRAIRSHAERLQAAPKSRMAAPRRARTAARPEVDAGVHHTGKPTSLRQCVSTSRAGACRGGFTPAIRHRPPGDVAGDVRRGQDGHRDVGQLGIGQLAVRNRRALACGIRGRGRRSRVRGRRAARTARPLRCPRPPRGIRTTSAPRRGRDVRPCGHPPEDLVEMHHRRDRPRSDFRRRLQHDDRRGSILHASGRRVGC